MLCNFVGVDFHSFPGEGVYAVMTSRPLKHFTNYTKKKDLWMVGDSPGGSVGEPFDIIL